MGAARWPSEAGNSGELNVPRLASTKGARWRRRAFSLAHRTKRREGRDVPHASFARRAGLTFRRARTRKRRGWMTQYRPCRPILRESLRYSRFRLVQQDLPAPYEAIFQLAPLPLGVVNDLREWVDANLALCELLGGGKSELMGRRLDDWMVENERGSLAAAWEMRL